ncbi:MAG: hypothetical protein MUO68_02575, partial [Desulfobacteraceae bacterium]|nr:hypothetical protein [Desulfobacteraceae bacterium]
MIEKPQSPYPASSDFQVLPHGLHGFASDSKILDSRKGAQSSPLTMGTNRTSITSSVLSCPPLLT